jgi:hypothetical protein
MHSLLWAAQVHWLLVVYKMLGCTAGCGGNFPKAHFKPFLSEDGLLPWFGRVWNSIGNDTLRRRKTTDALSSTLNCLWPCWCLLRSQLRDGLDLRCCMGYGFDEASVEQTKDVWLGFQKIRMVGTFRAKEAGFGCISGLGPCQRSTWLEDSFPKMLNPPKLNLAPPS